MKHSIKATALAVSAGLLCSWTSYAQESKTVYEAISSGKVYANFNLRYEGVEQDNALDDASALTFRTWLGYKSGSYKNFSFTVEMEDSRIVLGQGDFSVPPTGYRPGEYSVIADPETTELDQGFLQYKANGLTVKAGRQVITHDTHRFIGHVAWRQDKQTFDGVRTIYEVNEKLTLDYSYLTQRNRIFAEARDLDSKDHLLHASYKIPYGKLSAYTYLLEVDNDTENALDTYGVRFAGKQDAVSYSLEYATQSSETATTDFDADYMFAEVGYTFNPTLTLKLGYEVLGSDDGRYGFATPLATLHKFNGWSDQFLGTPAQGLKDLMFTATGSVAGGKWLAVYHKFDPDESSLAVDDFGNEINLQFVKPFAEHYTAAIKFAHYSAEDTRVDTDKIWIWFNAKF